MRKFIALLGIAQPTGAAKILDSVHPALRERDDVIDTARGRRHEVLTPSAANRLGRSDALDECAVSNAVRPDGGSLLDRSSLVRSGDSRGWILPIPSTRSSLDGGTVGLSSGPVSSTNQIALRQIPFSGSFPVGVVVLSRSFLEMFTVELVISRVVIRLRLINEIAMFPRQSSHFRYRIAFLSLSLQKSFRTVSILVDEPNRSGLFSLHG